MQKCWNCLRMQLTAVLSLLSRPVSRKEGHDRGMLGQMWGACLQTHKPVSPQLLQPNTWAPTGCCQVFIEHCLH